MDIRGAKFLAIGVLVLTAPISAQTEQEVAWIETFVPRLESPQAQIAHARRIKRRLAGAEGEELTFWRGLAVEAYQAVRLFHPAARAAGAEAAFRAGELLRAAEEDERALAEFRWCASQGGGTEFRTRARLEIGHLHRRHERWPEAREAYLDVAGDASAEPFRRDDAWYWAGMVWKTEGRTDDARAAWRRVAEQGSDALTRVQAYDALGLSLLESGDLEGAAGILHECLVRLSERALEETLEGERVRNGLLRMRLVEDLPREIARRKKSDGGQGSPRNP